MTEEQRGKELSERVSSLLRENALLAERIERLRESEDKFKTIFENANDHIVYMGIDGIVIDVNPKVEDLFGYKREEVVGKRSYEFGALTPDDWQRCIDLNRDLIEGRATHPRILELKAVRKDGTTVFIEVNPRLVVRDGEVKGILTITRDITARKREE
ncbi:MAG: PAS domain S-box protein, partial [Chloroflexi bacterium]|nr:PAS domain S-box protein [Chloroflexota bacterium]